MSGEVTPKHGLNPLYVGKHPTSRDNIEDTASNKTNRTLAIQTIAITILTTLVTAFVLLSLFVSKPITLALSLATGIAVGFCYYSFNYEEKHPEIPNKPPLKSRDGENTSPSISSEGGTEILGSFSSEKGDEGEPGLRTDGSSEEETASPSFNNDSLPGSPSDNEEGKSNKKTRTPSMTDSFVFVPEDPDANEQSSSSKASSNADKQDSTSPVHQTNSVNLFIIQPTAPQPSSGSSLPSAEHDSNIPPIPLPRPERYANAKRGNLSKRGSKPSRGGRGAKPGRGGTAATRGRPGAIRGVRTGPSRNNRGGSSRATSQKRTYEDLSPLNFDASSSSDPFSTYTTPPARTSAATREPFSTFSTHTPSSSSSGYRSSLGKGGGNIGRGGGSIGRGGGSIGRGGGSIGRGGHTS